MAKLLDRPKSRKERFLDAFARGGQALPGALDQYYQGKAKEGQGLAKNLSALSGFLPKEFKARGRGSLAEDPQILAQFREEMRPLLEQGFEPYEAFEKVFSNYLQSPEGQSGMEEEPGMVQRLLQKLGGKGLQKAKEPFSKGKALELMGSAFEPTKEAITESPSKAAASLGFGTVSPFTDLAETPVGEAILSPTSLIPRLLMGKKSPKITQELRSRLQHGSSEKAKKGMEELELLGSILPIESLLGLGSKGASAARRFLGREAEELGALSKGAKRAEKAVEAERSLAGRVGKAPETATEARIKRARPKERLYPKKEKILKREEQLKRFPRYAKEIEKDAAERLARKEKRIPKTERGLISQEKRIQAAQKDLPVIRESYHKSIARVRALEDEAAVLSKAQRKELEPLLEAAKKELKDAEFDFKQGLENLKGESKRSLVDEMRNRAREKALSIQFQIEDGITPQLSLADYNPRWEQEAKQLAQRKPLPKSAKKDFYHDVHQEYVDVYKQRLDRIQKEIKKLQERPSLPSVQHARQLMKERGLLQKMVRSAESEQKVHAHKLALREMGERKKAKDFISKFGKTEGKPKTAKVWKERSFKDMKSPEGRQRLSTEITEEAQRKAPSSQKEKVRQEKKKLEENLSKAHEKAQKYKKEINRISNSQEARKLAKNMAADFWDLFKNSKWTKRFLGTNPAWGMAQGVGSALIDEMFPDELKPYFRTSAMTYLLLGRKSRGIGTASALLTKALFHQLKLNKAVQAYKRHDDQALRKFSPSIKKKARERAFG